MDALHYLLKVNLCWAIFYIAYWALFRKHTFFSGNRLYLVASLLAGMCIPALELREQVDPLAMRSPLIRVASSTMPSNAAEIDIANGPLIVACVYLAGVCVMFFLLLKALVGIYIIIRSGVAIPMDECRLVLSQRGHARSGSFSFLRWMVVSPEDYAAHFEPIFAHERVHIRQWHSLDILLIELLKVFFWFNPVLWLYKSSLQRIHEFLADAQAPDKDRYAAFMVSYARQAMHASVTSKFFNKSLLKQRIHMIYKQRTPKWMGWKYVSIFPLLAVTVMLTATRKYEYSKPEADTRNINVGGPAAEPLVKSHEAAPVPEAKVRTKWQANARIARAGLPIATGRPTGVGNKSTADSLPELKTLIARLSTAVSNNDLKSADSLKKAINPIIWSESARLRKEQTEVRLRSQGLAASIRSQNPPTVLARLSSDVKEVSEERFQARWDSFDQIRTQFDEIVSNLRHQMSDATAEADKATQEQIIQELIAAGAAAGKENLSYRLHNMFLIVNGVEQPEALHQKLKSRYLKYGWMEWVYNWDGATGHRFTGVRFNG